MGHMAKQCTAESSFDKGAANVMIEIGSEIDTSGVIMIEVATRIDMSAVSTSEIEASIISTIEIVAVTVRVSEIDASTDASPFSTVEMMVVTVGTNMTGGVTSRLWYVCMPRWHLRIRAARRGGRIEFGGYDVSRGDGR